MSIDKGHHISVTDRRFYKGLSESKETDINISFFFLKSLENSFLDVQVTPFLKQ